MSKFLRAAAIMATVVLGASASQAQTIAMAGEYSEGNGIIIQIPQNPPNVSCTYPATDDSRCLRNNQKFFGQGAGPVTLEPHHGVYGAGLMNPPGVAGGTKANGLNVGDSFTVPSFFMKQRLGNQIGIVLNAAVVQLDTAFTAAAPGPSRTKNPQPGLRQFSAMNWSQANVQNDGATVNGGADRLAANTNISRIVGLETLNVSYTAGPQQFGGTMGVLLDGTGRLYLGDIAAISSPFPPSWLPVVASNPVGDTNPGFRTRNAAGWNYTVQGSQVSGRIKAFGPGIPAGVPKTDVRGPACGITAPPSPLGCNEVNGFDTFGLTAGGFGAATSTKHMFAWTTGTVQIIRTGVRNPGPYTVTDTVTGMGYDSIGTDAGVDTRKVGMIAGSYTVRTDGIPATVLNFQMVGVDFKMTPEPGATVALLSGLGMLGALATRRRR